MYSCNSVVRRKYGNFRRNEDRTNCKLGMLSNEKFLAKAPESKVNEEKEKMARYQQMLDDVTKRLAEMK